MNWIIQNGFFILSGLMFAGFIILGCLMIRLHKKIKIIFGEIPGSEINLPKDLIMRMHKAEMKLADIESRLKLTETIADLSIHKIGFLRFNPFQDTGGDNSFVLALLDRDSTGVLISSLYTRNGVRVYGKQIQYGKSKYPLSEEEKKVLEETLSKGIRN